MPLEADKNLKVCVRVVDEFQEEDAMDRKRCGYQPSGVRIRARILK